MTKITIDPEFVDVVFPDQPEYLFGCVDEGPYDQMFGDVYEDAVQVLSESELREAAEHQDEFGGGEELVTRIFNQKREGSCVANATGQGHQCVQAKTYGKEHVVQLSAMSIYKQIGRSANSGARVSNGLKTLKNLGALPLDTPENKERFQHTFPNTGFNTRYPTDWKETADTFRCVETHVVRSFNGILTALARQEPVIVGREGHSICYVRLIWKNGWKVMYVNSWSQGWGISAGDFKGGFGVDSSRQIEKSASWAFVVRTIKPRKI